MLSTFAYFLLPKATFSKKYILQNGTFSVLSGLDPDQIRSFAGPGLSCLCSDLIANVINRRQRSHKQVNGF